MDVDGVNQQSASFAPPPPSAAGASAMFDKTGIRRPLGVQQPQSAASPVTLCHNLFMQPQNQNSSLFQRSYKDGGMDLTLQNIPPGTPADIPPLPVEEDDTLDLQQISSECIPPVVPSCSRWFSLERIHPLEAEHMKLLFQGLSGVQLIERQNVYMRARNKIVERYRQTPRRYLSITDCRKIIDSDCALVMRLHAFLEQWGIINFQADPSSFPKRLNRLKEIRMSHIKELSLDPSEAKRAKTQAQSPTNSKSPVRCACCSRVCLYTYFTLRPNIANVSQGVLDKCVWCVCCFSNGRFPSQLNAMCFHKVTVPLSGRAECGWSDEETLRLLEGIERYREDWEGVAAHVGNGRSVSACVSRFISLPIDDNNSPPIYNKPKSSSLVSFAPKEADGNDVNLPTGVEALFEGANNPLLSQLAFVASLINPVVASAAAKAAIDEAARQADLVVAMKKSKHNTHTHTHTNTSIENFGEGKTNTSDATYAHTHTNAHMQFIFLIVFLFFYIFCFSIY
eukprot:GHVR01042181.1.p1 GENE.GHVR01042181.1~~GHVR01042181.1.p1  ORF type:complete len:509 (+),score=150.94 GHVR01042181.1:693-2219(+)